jgi:hypothetical protein
LQEGGEKAGTVEFQRPKFLCQVWSLKRLQRQILDEAMRVMNMIRKGQVRGVGKGDIKGQVSFIASLFGVAA